MNKYDNHYNYLSEHLADFLRQMVPIRRISSRGLISAHGDKCYGYRDLWEKAGIPFHKGVAIYLLTYCRPYSQEVRETEKGWVQTENWIVENKDRFLPFLPD